MRSAILAGALLLAGALPAGAQRPAATADSVREAAGISPPLPVDHWAIGAVRRLDQLGLAGGAVVDQPGLSRRQAERILREAATRGDAWAATASAWHQRLLDEFPELGESRRVIGGAAVTARYLGTSGALAPSANRANRPQPPVPLPDESGPYASLAVAGPSAGPITFVAEPRVGPEAIELPSWDVVVGTSSLAASVGRGAVAYGPGGIVFGGAPFGRVQLYTPRPFHIAGPLRYLGPVSFHSFLGQLTEARHRDDPYVAGARLSIQPHPRLRIGASRGAMLGGDSARFDVSPVYLFRTLIGFNQDENQIVSADVRLRLPSESVLPLTAYLEWGTDDIAGGYKETPAYVVGLASPALPFAPEVSLGAERTFFHEQCCGHGFWYRHNRFQGNWAVDAAPLGHPLGGHGSELAGYGALDLIRAGFRLDARASWRDRGDENLYAPDRVGRSVALRLDAAWRLRSRAELRARAHRESGDGWDEEAVDGGLSVFF